MWLASHESCLPSRGTDAAPNQSQPLVSVRSHARFRGVEILVRQHLGGEERPFLYSSKQYFRKIKAAFRCLKSSVSVWGTASSTGGGLSMSCSPGRRGQFGDVLNRSISQAGQHVAEIIADWDLESAAAFDYR